MSKSIDMESLSSFFEERPNCEMVCLFGSAADGIVEEGSDVDLAMLFAAKPGIREQATLRADLQSLMHDEEIDTVVLNGASPWLRFEAFRGRRVHSRDRSKEAVFASLTAREYEDERTMFEKAMPNRSANSTIPPPTTSST
jgi:predicted nucleotidyltransferase